MRAVEALLALTLGAAVTTAVWQVAVEQGKAVRRLDEASRRLAAVQGAAMVLDWELSPGDTGVPVEDEIPLRAWRGWGRGCTHDARGVVVHWEGIRSPDPRRDSLLVIALDGSVRVTALSSVRGVAAVPGCGPGTPLRLVWETGPGSGTPPVAWVRAFERGFYRIDSALRYRRGRGGAQPLTEELLDPGRSGWSLGGPGLQVELWGAGEPVSGVHLRW